MGLKSRPAANSNLRGKKSLTETHPNLAAQWHPTKNEGGPEDYSAGSDKRVRWNCPVAADHEWESAVGSRTRKGSAGGCPFCAGKRASVTNSLASLFPEVAKEWHPAKNPAGVTPEAVVGRSGHKYWWLCSLNDKHEWEAVVGQRTARGSGCLYCAGQRVLPEDSLAGKFTELMSEWHPKNKVDPFLLTPSSHKVRWWKCAHGHEWQASPGNRTKRAGTQCPFCSGNRPTKATSLATLRPDIASRWHPTRNEPPGAEEVSSKTHRTVWWQCSKNTAHEWEATIANMTTRASFSCPACNSFAGKYPEVAKEWHPSRNDRSADRVSSGSNAKVWWKCTKGPDHEWLASPNKRSAGRGCPFCRGLKVSVTNSLATQGLHLLCEWHPSKNPPGLTPAGVTAHSGKKMWWRCSKDSSHEWLATPRNRLVQKSGCPVCSGRQAAPTRNLAISLPDLAAQWHPTKNAPLTPMDVVPGGKAKHWWKCSEGPDHEWLASVHSRKKHPGCAVCSGQQVAPSTSLQHRFPDIAAEWHPDKNGAQRPIDVVPFSNAKVWWRCKFDTDHEWQADIGGRTNMGAGCPICHTGWNRVSIEHFVRSLRGNLESLTPAELYVVFQQSGLLSATGKGKSFLRALATGRFPVDEISKFVDGQPSLVDKFFDDKEQTLDAELEAASEDAEDALDAATVVAEEEIDPSLDDLPTIQAKDVLAAVDAAAAYTTDQEAVEFLIASAKEKLWKHAYVDEAEAVTQARNATVGEYSETVRDTFLVEHEQATALPLPSGYAFKVAGKIAKPNLMQRCIANRVLRERRVGNWSGTGAGKTLSAVLSSRVVDASFTVVCCPNTVVDGWEAAILDIFPDSDVVTKTLHPTWSSNSKHRYLVVNYEMFQQSDSPGKIAKLLEQSVPDFVVIDEIHYAKQRHVENISRRREVVMAFITQSAERNPDFRVLGMSATPVINNLQEGKALVEMITGETHDDLETKANVPNCMKLHQRLVTIGSRWMPNYDFGYDQQEIEVDCSDYIEEVRALGKGGSTVALEAILTKARLPTIRENIVPKTLIYTHYLQGITDQLKDALTEDGWKVGFYTGQDKTGLNGFLHGDVDVLIGSSSIGTGVDGLQHVCDRMIINVLPWTNAEFEQLKGRIFRQGREKGSKVTMIIPLTYAEVNGEEWSWCKAKMRRLQFKKSIADAAVDGVVPEGHLRTPAQAYKDLVGWLERLASGEIETIDRTKIVVPLPPSIEKSYRGRFGDFSKMNRHWNTTGSEKTHQRLESDPQEWSHYHTLYREARKSWTVIPFEEMIKWFSQREGRVIGDFGCGEAKLAEALVDRHVVHSFDHVAINDDVLTGDMSNTPLPDEELDDAVFCLSLMGANFTDYLREAHRTLKIDGQLHLWIATSRFKDRDGFVEGLGKLGFELAGTVRDEGKFTKIRALRTTREPTDIVLRF